MTDLELAKRRLVIVCIGLLAVLSIWLLPQVPVLAVFLASLTTLGYFYLVIFGNKLQDFFGLFAWVLVLALNYMRL